MTNEEWTVQERRIGSLRQAGYSLRDIARETGISQGTIGRRLRQLGIKAPPLPPSPPREVSRCAAPRVLRVLPPGSDPDLTHALNLARETLRRVAPPTLAEADAEDWFSIARLAALKALATYDPERCARWQTWVISKVRWTILEHLRNWDCHTRTERKQVKETGTRLRARPLSLETLFGCHDEGDFGWENALTGEVEAAPEEGWLRARCVRDAVAALPPRLRFVVQRQQAGYTYQEIGVSLGLSEQRVQQLATEAKEHLREELAAWA